MPKYAFKDCGIAVCAENISYVHLVSGVFKGKYIPFPFLEKAGNKLLHTQLVHWCFRYQVVVFVVVSFTPRRNILTDRCPMNLSF